MAVRRRYVLPLGVALVAGFATALGISWSSGSPEDDSAGPNGSAATTLEPAAAGRRWFALDNVVVEIPERWAQSERSCRDRVTGSVVSDRNEWRRCLALGRFAPSLQLLQTDERASGRYVKEATVRVPGFDQITQPVFEGPARRTPLLHRSGGVHQMALVVPADDHVFLVEAKSAALVRQVVTSARLLPEGTSVVPLTPRNDELGGGFLFPQESEIRVRTKQVASELVAGYVVETDPPPGTPIPPGSTIEVLVSSGPDGPAIGNRRFARATWAVDPPGQGTPAYSRRQLLRKVGSPDDSRATQIFLRRVTVRDYGFVSADGRVDPKIERRLVWLVINPDALFPRSGPCLGVRVRAELACKPQPPWYVADAATLYDANTGRFLVARSF
jgi:PASTA domain